MPRDSIEIHLIFACDEGGRDDMIRKIFGPLVMTVVLFAAVLPRAGAMHIVSEDKKAGELSFEAVFSMVPYNEDTSGYTKLAYMAAHRHWDEPEHWKFSILSR